MRVHRLDDMTRGWFVGDFTPTLYRTDAVEVAVKHYAAGDAEARHVHRVATELTAVVAGSVRMDGRELGAGDIAVLEPGDASDFLALSDAVVVAVKLPAAPGDKYPAEAQVLTIVIPMAGRGSRFADAGYELPKPLLPVHGVPMIEVVVANLRPSVPARFVFVCRREHLAAYGLEDRLREIAPGCAVVAIDEVTEGAACTVLLAEREIDPADALVVANSDQWVDTSFDEHLARLHDGGLDGLIMTMWADHPKWSYAEVDERGAVTRVVEKEVVSNEATVGIYTFARGGDFVRAARAMIAADERVGGEFYVAPVYNRLIAEGAAVGVHNIGAVGDGMYGLGVPEDLDDFLSRPVSRRAAGIAG